MLIILAFVIIFILFLIVPKYLAKLVAKHPSFKDSATSSTSTFEMDKPPTALDRILRKVARNRSKNYGKYKPGYLGISAVSRAIKKDYGAILSRRQRKYCAKAYGIPFVIYRGN